MAVLVAADVGPDDALHPPVGQLVAQLVPHLHSPLPPILVLRRSARAIAIVARLEDSRIEPTSCHFKKRWIHFAPVFPVVPLGAAFALIHKKIMNFHRRENSWPDFGQWKLQLLPGRLIFRNNFLDGVW